LGAVAALTLAAILPAAPEPLTVKQVSQALVKATPGNPPDFSHAELIGLDLSDLDFKGAKLSGADLLGANLSRSNLAGADLSGQARPRDHHPHELHRRRPLGGEPVRHRGVFDHGVSAAR
jgi:hypothetical protein